MLFINKCGGYGNRHLGQVKLNNDKCSKGRSLWQDLVVEDGRLRGSVHGSFNPKPYDKPPKPSVFIDKVARSPTLEPLKDHKALDPRALP